MHISESWCIFTYFLVQKYMHLSWTLLVHSIHSQGFYTYLYLRVRCTTMYHSCIYYRPRYIIVQSVGYSIRFVTKRVLGKSRGQKKNPLPFSAVGVPNYIRHAYNNIPYTYRNSQRVRMANSCWTRRPILSRFKLLSRLFSFLVV